MSKFVSVARSYAVPCLVALALISSGCTESPSAPTPVRSDLVQLVTPLMADAHARIAADITDFAIRNRALAQLRDLQSALLVGDQESAREHLHDVGSTVVGYAANSVTIVNGDAPDVAHLRLALYHAAILLDARPYAYLLP
jgi:hypothetical protein